MGVAAGFVFLLAACSSPAAKPAPSASSTARPAAASQSPAVFVKPTASGLTAVHIVRTPGLFILPPLDETITNHATAEKLAEKILALPPMPKGIFNCPVDFGTSYALTFEASGGVWTASVSVKGCTVVSLSDGRNLWAIRSPQFFPYLAAVLDLTQDELFPMPCPGTEGSGCYPQPGMGQGLVAGGIVPCSGLPLPRGWRYAAGTVTVLAGQAAWPTVGSAPAFPETVVATQPVQAGQTYAFTLHPGHYVLQAHLAPPATVVPWINVTVSANKLTRVDVPNICK
jgi:hypothetical protein